MARKKQWCEAVACRHKIPHRTRRLGAEGRPSCSGAHGQVGHLPRGNAKRAVDRKLSEREKNAMSAWQTRKRVTGKGTAAWTPGKWLRTPARRLLRQTCAASSLAPAATECIAFSDVCSTIPYQHVKGVLTAVATSACECRPDTLDSDFEAILRLIDSPFLGPKLGLINCYHLKGTARAVLEAAARWRARSAFLLATTSVWALAVLYIALSLTPGGVLWSSIDGKPVQLDARMTCDLVEPDADVRRLAKRIGPQLVNYLYQSPSTSGSLTDGA